MRILGFVALATLLIPICVMRMRVQPKQARSIIDWSAFTDTPWITFVFGGMIGFIGLYVSFFYTSYYGQATGLTNASLSFYLVPILNAGSVFGRTLPNILSDKIGPLNVITPGAFLVGVVLLSYMAVESAGGLVVAALFFGRATVKVLMFWTSADCLLRSQGSVLVSSSLCHLCSLWR